MCVGRENQQLSETVITITPTRTQALIIGTTTTTRTKILTILTTTAITPNKIEDTNIVIVGTTTPKITPIRAATPL